MANAEFIARNRWAFMVVALLWMGVWYAGVGADWGQLRWASTTTLEVVGGRWTAMSPAAGWLILGAPLVGGVALAHLNRTTAVVAAVVFAAASAASMVHLVGGFEPHRVVYFWGAIWLLWLALNLDRGDPGFVRDLRRVTASTVVMILFCGAVGRWTWGYWSGEILRNVHFAHSQGILFAVLRDILSEEALEAVATIYSRGVVVAQTGVVLALLFRFRIFAIAAGVVLVVGAPVMGADSGGVVLLLGSLLVVTLFVGSSSNLEEDRQRSRRWSIWGVVAVHMICVLVAVVLSFYEPLQRVWLKEHHHSLEGVFPSVAIAFVPTMGTMEHRAPRLAIAAEPEQELDEVALRSCLRRGTPRWGIEPAWRRLMTPQCHQALVEVESPLRIELHSRYRGTCVGSIFRATLGEESGSQALRVEQLEVVDSCSGFN